MREAVNYPQYRKYKHERTYFKIISGQEWEEIHILGKKYSIHRFKASILPDRNYIHDLTFNYKDNWIKIDAEEYESVLKQASQSEG